MPPGANMVPNDMSAPATMPPARTTREGTVFNPEATAPLDLDALAIEEQQRTLLAKVFSLMTLGLMTSATVAFLTLQNSGVYEYTLHHTYGFQSMFLFEMAAVAFISKYVDKLTIPMAWVLFLFYAGFNGISFALFFLFLPPTAVVFGFFLTALSFGVMALYGRYTKCDLGSLKSLGMLVLAGIILMTVFNLVLGHGEAFYATSFLGIMIFAGLTASHIQDIRNLEWEFDDDDASYDKAALIGALFIYLDFVNLYMIVMRSVAQLKSRRIES